MGGVPPTQPAWAARVSPRRLTVAAAALDLALVVVFALIGRSSHDSGLDVAGVTWTAVPFAVGAGLGWLVGRAWRWPLSIVRAGLPVWALTVVVGVAGRLALGGGAPVSFVIVTAIVLGVLLLGWRGVAALVAPSRPSGR